MVQIDGGYSTTEHSGYTEYIADSGSMVQITIEDNDTFENAHLNQEASGSSFQIITYHNTSNINDNWTIRNVGVTGTRSNNHVLFAPASLSSGRIEHCYFGDGDAYYPGDPHGQEGFCWVPRQHSGHIEVHGCFVEGFTDNGWYTSAPGYFTGSGTFEFTNCYARNCHISLYRLGGATSPGTDRVDNCYGYTSSNDHRGVWAYDGAEYTELINSDIEADGSTALVASGYVYIENTSYSSGSSSGGTIDVGPGCDGNPTHFTPEGCPTTASEAYTGEAAGGGSDDGGSTDPNALDPVDPSPYDATIVYRNEDGETTSEGDTPSFYHQTEGEIEETTDYDTSISESVWQEGPNDYHATGNVQWREAFRYNYPTVGLEADDPITVEINGEVVDPDNYDSPDKQTPPGDDDPNMSRLNSETFDHEDVANNYSGNTNHWDIDQA